MSFVLSSDFRDARLAQSVERQPFKLVVVGSSPTVGKSSFFFLQIRVQRNSNTPDGTRTRNPRLRRAMPYPLGHRSLGVENRDKSE